LKIVLKLRTIQQLQPVSLHRCHVVSQIFLKQSIYPFRLSIDLQMVGSGKLQPCSYHVEQRYPEYARESHIAITYDVKRYSKILHHVSIE